MKISAGYALTLALAFLFLFPLPVQATDDCDIYANPACEYNYPDPIFQFPGHTFGDESHSVNLGNPQSQVAFSLVKPSTTWISQEGLERHIATISCQATEETYFTVTYDSLSGLSSDVIFQGETQSISTTTTPLGDHSRLTVSFGVPEFATLSPYECQSEFGFSYFDGSLGDGLPSFTLTLSRAFTPSTSTSSPSATTPSATTPATSTPSTASASPTPSALARATNEKAATETNSRKIQVYENADGQSEASPVGFLIVGMASALVGIGATVAFFQRKTIIRLIAKLKR